MLSQIHFSGSAASPNPAAKDVRLIPMALKILGLRDPCACFIHLTYICFIILGCNNMTTDHVCPDTWNGESFRVFVEGRRWKGLGRGC